MNKTIPHFILVGFMLLFISSAGKTCTTFCIKDSENLIFGRNLDFSTDFGHVIVNKRNMTKTAFIQSPEKPVKWTAKYGSITFNQAGREFPYGGINEKGLVIEQMWLDETVYPEIDHRSGLSELQWIQYQLDNSATVHDVIASDTIVRISKLSTAPLHFLICDQYGNMATIEYLKGEMIYHTSTTLPLTVLANDSYEKSTDYVKSFSDFGGTETLSNTSGSLDRFAKAASMIKKYKSQHVIDFSFDILNDVSQGDATQWSIVYDIKNLTVYYKTLQNKSVRKFDLNGFDFSCQSPSLYVDMAENMINEKLDFKVCSYQSNRELIDNVFNNVSFLQSIPASAREFSARYPDTTKCHD